MASSPVKSNIIGVALTLATTPKTSVIAHKVTINFFIILFFYINKISFVCTASEYR
jgi:hypothetical protein